MTAWSRRWPKFYEPPAPLRAWALLITLGVI